VPARPSGKGRFSEGKAFGSGKGRMRRFTVARQNNI
jgi:hypothetical protein